MERIVECVPNFSEGRNADIINAIVAEIRGVRGVVLLDQAPDESHNRVVVTFAGEPEAVEEAAFSATRKAAELIDMEKHRGEHPRIGATDVVPFVPVAGVTMAECVEMARRFGKRVADELQIPVYLYAEAATRQDRKRLPDIRRGEYEGLKLSISHPDRRPDFGEPRMHPTAGATVVGARQPLIAFNVNLDTADVKVASTVARAVRESSGGLVNVQAKGVFIREKQLAQVTINLLDHEKTPLHRVLELVRLEARRYGADVVETEIVGLIPLAALVNSAAWYLQVGHLSTDQVLELAIRSGGAGRPAE
ncbi:MAG: glutamate formimidoyltransferase [Firmicutes bacterium]|nr:glutamate formimidoyltransferase [Bacillota bacterium]